MALSGKRALVETIGLS